MSVKPSVDFVGVYLGSEFAETAVHFEEFCICGNWLTILRYDQ